MSTTEDRPERQQFQAGEIVDVAIKGVRIFAGRTEGGTVTEGLAIVDEHGRFYNLPPRAEITRAAPAEWPPQLNDLWRSAKGRTWWAIEVYPNGSTRAEIVLMNADADWLPGDVVLRAEGPMTLVHREQQDGGEDRG